MICKENDMKKRTLALALAALMLLSSCSSGTGDETKAPSSETKGTEKTEESAETEEVTSYKDDLGAHNYNGESFGIMTFENQNFHYEVTADEMLALPINDAMYKATTDIEDRFNRQREKCSPKEKRFSWICRSSSLKSFVK